MYVCLQNRVQFFLYPSTEYGFAEGFQRSSKSYQVWRKLFYNHMYTISFVKLQVIGDDTIALQSVLESDTVRESLLAEEASINKQMAEG